MTFLIWSKFFIFRMNSTDKGGLNKQGFGEWEAGHKKVLTVFLPQQVYTFPLNIQSRKHIN